LKKQFENMIRKKSFEISCKLRAAGSEIPVPCFWHTERVVRKAKAFRGGANKTAPPCETGTGNKYLATVPVEQLQ